LRAGDAAPLARLTLIGPDYVKVVSAKAPRKVADRGRRVAASQEAKAAPKTKAAAPTLDKAPDQAPDTAPNQTPDQTPPEADNSASE
ncbi:MAG: hypothetical protein LBT38_02255, partial [Deltaproteobacteria bacterium]|nr:hypothetical protein [Deltaproteobacteria bacterium]